MLEPTPAISDKYGGDLGEEIKVEQNTSFVANGKVIVETGLDSNTTNVAEKLKGNIKNSREGYVKVAKLKDDESLRMVISTKQQLELKTRPHKCPSCPKLFAQRSYLHQHMRTHSGEKPYKCTICDKFFSQMSNLNQHVRIHTGEKPYKCASCEKSFAQLSHLNQHTRTHTGERPYKCLLCNQGFSQMSGLGHHMKKHKTTIEEKEHKCMLCGKAFSLNLHLHEHMKIHSAQPVS